MVKRWIHGNDGLKKIPSKLSEMQNLLLFLTSNFFPQYALPYMRSYGCLFLKSIKYQ